MSRLNKEFDKLDFEKSELAYQEFERCRRNPGQPMTSYLRDMDRTYTKRIKEDEGTRLSEATLARKLLRRSGLKHDEKRHVLASCGHEYNHDKTRTALRLTNAMRTATTPGVASLRRPRLHRLLTRSRPSGGSRNMA